MDIDSAPKGNPMLVVRRMPTSTPRIVPNQLMLLTTLIGYINSFYELICRPEIPSNKTKISLKCFS